MTRLRVIGQKLRPSKAAKLIQRKITAPFYTSAEWRSLIAEIIRIRGRYCEDPKHDHALPRSGVRIIGDHIVELKDGGDPLNPRNIMLRCPSCHNRKTIASRKHRYEIKSMT